MRVSMFFEAYLKVILIDQLSYYIVPGVLILCIGQCSTATAIGISADIQKGIVDCFRSMPIATSSVLNGHVIESVL